MSKTITVNNNFFTAIYFLVFVLTLLLLLFIYLIGYPLLDIFGVCVFSSACLKCHITSVLHLLPPQTQCENESPVNYL